MSIQVGMCVAEANSRQLCWTKKIHNFQSTKKVQFWPVKANAHYASFATTWLESLGIVFVTKHDNPPNCLQVHPIDAILNMEVYERGWIEKNKADFAKTIKTCAKNFPANVCQNCFRNLPTKNLKFADNGLKTNT